MATVMTMASGVAILGLRDEGAQMLRPQALPTKGGGAVNADIRTDAAVACDAVLEAKLHGLLQGMVRRDEVALADFYDATVGKAYGLALRITRQPEAAEEVVEDVYLQAWRDAARFDPGRGRVLTWLLTICRSRALDYLRRKDCAELHPDPQELQTGAAAEDKGADPLDLLQATESSAAVHQALAQLAPLPRQLIALAFFRGLTHQEIADFCRMPLGTVKTTLQRAFKQMRAFLAGSDWCQEREPRND